MQEIFTERIGFFFFFLVEPLVLIEEFGFYPVGSRELRKVLEQGTACAARLVEWYAAS